MRDKSNISAATLYYIYIYSLVRSGPHCFSHSIALAYSQRESEYVQCINYRILCAGVNELAGCINICMFIFIFVCFAVLRPHCE